MSEAPEVLFETRGHLGLITLNRPRALNALTGEMCLAMRAQLARWADDAAIRTVAIQGAGERAFCAGGDIRALAQSGKAGVDEVMQFYRDEYPLNAMIKHYPKPFVAFLKGFVMGAGFGLSAHGSHRIADESVIFSMPETAIGMIPDIAASYVLPRIRGEIGLYLALTALRIKTSDYFYTGLATHVVPATGTAAMLERLAAGQHPDEAVVGLGVATGEPPLIEDSADIERIFMLDSVEEILQALDEDASPWARGTARILRTRSPLCLKLTYRQMREGAKLEFDDCLRMEFRITSRIMAGHDFYEGVRATLIDRDNAPKWQPARLADVSDADVAAYFAPLGEKELEL